jgi:hypothetical protein
VEVSGWRRGGGGELELTFFCVRVCTNNHAQDSNKTSVSCINKEFNLQLKIYVYTSSFSSFNLRTQAWYYGDLYLCTHRFRLHIHQWRYYLFTIMHGKEGKKEGKGGRDCKEEEGGRRNKKE